MELEQLNPRQFDRFRAFIYKMSGIRVNDNRLTLLSNRIRRRLKAGAFPTFEAYYDYLTSPKGKSEVEHFLDEITTNETFFFRTPTHFDWFTSEFIGELARNERSEKRDRSLRIWSAGCATGAEPYTLAISLLENRFRLRDLDISILGTDLSEEALRMARVGTFRARAVEGTPANLKKRYFQPVEGDRWQVQPALRELVTFEHHNLMTPLRHPPFDCIFIRNVLIYFDRASKLRVVGHLIRALAPGGYLVVGPSEGIYDMLEPLERQSTFLYRKTPGAVVTRPAAAARDRRPSIGRTSSDSGDAS